MAGLMESIFGGGVKQLTEQRRLQQEKDIQSQLALAARRREVTPSEQFGTAFGTTFGEGLARGIFGDPEMEEREQAEIKIAALAEEFGLDSPQYLLGVAEIARSQGELGTATALMARADKRAEELAKEGAFENITTTDINNTVEFMRQANPEIFEKVKEDDIKPLAFAITQDLRQSEENQLKQRKEAILDPNKVVPAMLSPTASTKIIIDNYLNKNIIKKDGSWFSPDLELDFNNKYNAAGLGNSKSAVEATDFVDEPKGSNKANLRTRGQRRQSGARDDINIGEDFTGLIDSIIPDGKKTQFSRGRNR